MRLTESIGSFPAGRQGAAVEVYTAPYEAYDLEIVDDAGKTAGLLEAVRPDQLEVVSGASGEVRFASIRLEHAGATATVAFSDGKQAQVSAAELYPVVK